MHNHNNKRPFDILLIEDNEADVELTREAMLAYELPVNLHVVRTGEQALHYLSRSDTQAKLKRPDLILLDLNLPGMDGREVLERFKIDPNLRHIPVIVLTSAQADLDLLKSYSMGANCFIRKPVDPNNFLQIIKQIQDFWCGVVQLPNNELVEHYRVSYGSLAQPFLRKRNPEEPIRVLYVEDSDADSEIVFQNLNNLSEPRFTSHREIRLADTFNYLEKNTVDVILLDLSLPDSEGFETVLRFHAHSPLLPLVVLTGAEDKAMGIRAVKEGADDYLVKSQVHSELLGRTLLHAIERKAGHLSQLDALARERSARNDAEKAIGIRDEFLSIAGHELRHPLTSLKMQMYVLMETLKKSEKDPILYKLVQKIAETADEQVDRFGKLIDTLLNSSNIQSGRLKLEYSKFDINKIILDSVARFNPELKNAGCEIILNFGSAIEGEWDSLRVEQVLINLLSNGIKYAPGKPIVVKVTSDANSVWICITDQGPGIAPQDRERIFQRFERAHKTIAVPGLGLGLYVVRQIIDTHGGTILLNSELGVGSTFTVCLPRKPNRIPQEFITK